MEGNPYGIDIFKKIVEFSVLKNTIIVFLSLTLVEVF